MMVPVTMFLGMPLLVVVVVVMRVTVHGAIGMPMLVRMVTQRATLDPGLTFSATAYRTHLQSPRIRIRRLHAGPVRTSTPTRRRAVQRSAAGPLSLEQ
jgi:hypothetical protein